ncbi:replication initiation protein [Acidovorax delafieldii]|mgnify:CR=1 FL=1|jgi:hypothetical protein|uniref:RepB family plasmid replication initiator protein n=1 Tax=Acidovorax delafieldii TaxID=47920 RepID=UPI003ECCA39B
MPRKNQLDQHAQIALFHAPEAPNAFRKAVQVIHSKPKTELSLLHRKIANAWLKNAVETTPDSTGFWTIHTSTMETEIGYNSKNREYLINSARALMGIAFEWDVISGEGKRKFWKASVFYPDVEILEETIRYTISKPLLEMVLKPDMYALIDMNVLKKFRRTSSLGLYEFCTRFEKIKKTADVEWQLLRDMIMGEAAEGKSYQEYKVFKDKVMKLAIAEINAESDIEIELIEKKMGRRVTTISFLVEKRKTQITNTVDDEQQLLDIGELVKVGVLQSEARTLVKQYPHEHIAAALDYTRKRVADKKGPKIDSPAAYLRKALASGWGLQEGKVSKSKASATPNASGEIELESMYRIEQLKQAEAYFAELNPDDQQGLVNEYNATDLSPAFRIKNSKPGKAVRTEFFKWLALKTWGHPKAEDLVEYAQKLMKSQGLLKIA